MLHWRCAYLAVLRPIHTVHGPCPRPWTRAVLEKALHDNAFFRHGPTPVFTGRVHGCVYWQHGWQKWHPDNELSPQGCDAYDGQCDARPRGWTTLDGSWYSWMRCWLTCRRSTSFWSAWLESESWELCFRRLRAWHLHRGLTRPNLRQTLSQPSSCEKMPFRTNSAVITKKNAQL